MIKNIKQIGNTFLLAKCEVKRKQNNGWMVGTCSAAALHRSNCHIKAKIAVLYFLAVHKNNELKRLLNYCAPFFLLNRKHSLIKKSLCSRVSI